MPKADNLPSMLPLPARLDSSTAEMVHGAMVGAVAGPGEVVVDMSQVSLIDTQVIQVLLATAKSLAGAGRAFRLHKPSPAVEEAFALLGLADELEQWRQVDA